MFPMFETRFQFRFQMSSLRRTSRPCLPRLRIQKLPRQTFLRSMWKPTEAGYDHHLPQSAKTRHSGSASRGFSHAGARSSHGTGTRPVSRPSQSTAQCQAGGSARSFAKTPKSQFVDILPDLSGLRGGGRPVRDVLRKPWTLEMSDANQ